MNLVHNEAASQFEYHERPLTEVSPKGSISYLKDDQYFYITNVQVPTRFAGKGIGSKMVSEVISHAGQMGLKVVPKCSFAKSFMDKKGFNYNNN